MSQVRVRRSKLPLASSLGMVALGVFALFAVNSWLGIALILVGSAMFFAYERVAKRPRRDEGSAPTG